MDDIVSRITFNKRGRYLFYKAEVTLKPMECKCIAATIDYFGHVTRPGCLELSHDTTNLEAKLEHPGTKSKVFSFLGLCNVSRHFTPNFPALLLFSTKN